MRRTDTKQRILNESLKLFSEHGYEAVGVEMIAAAVKVTPPSLYKHFSGKGEIVEAITDMVEELYEEHSLSIAELDDIDIEQMDEEAFVNYLIPFAENVLHDSTLKSIIKLLTIEQFRNETMRRIYVEKCYKLPEQFSYNLVKRLLMLRKPDDKVDLDYQVKLMTFPVITTIKRCYCDPKYETEGMAFLQKHLRNIWKLYLA
jgi:AcrR family transcriptional regulator